MKANRIKKDNVLLYLAEVLVRKEATGGTAIRGKRSFIVEMLPPAAGDANVSRTSRRLTVAADSLYTDVDEMATDHYCRSDPVAGNVMADWLEDNDFLEAANALRKAFPAVPLHGSDKDAFRFTDLRHPAVNEDVSFGDAEVPNVEVVGKVRVGARQVGAFRKYRGSDHVCLTLFRGYAEMWASKADNNDLANLLLWEAESLAGGRPATESVEVIENA